MCDTIRVNIPRVLGYGIEPSRVQRVTAEDPADGEVHSHQRSMFLQRFRGVVGTGGVKPAVIAGNEGGDDPLVQPDEADEDDAHVNCSLILCSRPVISSRTSGNETAPDEGLVRGDQRKTTFNVRSGRSPGGPMMSLLFL
jgi:hypothetical protein